MSEPFGMQSALDQAIENPNDNILVASSLIEEMVALIRSNPYEVVEAVTAKLKETQQELDVTRQRAQDAIKETNGLRKEAAEAYKKLRGVTRGENAYQFECTEKGPFSVRVKVLYEVTDGDEIMVTNIEKLEDAERYCKQFNIEDRMGDGRVDFGGNTPNELGGFIEENQQWVRNILALQPDVEAYLATLPSEDE